MNTRIVIVVLVLAVSILAVAVPARLQVAAQEVGYGPAGSAPTANTEEQALRATSPLTSTARYTITDLGTLEGRSSRAAAVNEHGQVVGYR